MANDTLGADSVSRWGLTSIGISIIRVSRRDQFTENPLLAREGEIWGVLWDSQLQRRIIILRM